MIAINTKEYKEQYSCVLPRYVKDMARVWSLLWVGDMATFFLKQKEQIIVIGNY